MERRSLPKHVFIIAATIIFLTQITVLGQSKATHSNSPAAKPNVVLIYIDDLGYGDLGCYGSEKNDTPHVDQLAKEGMLFTDYYSASPVCTPSRAALLTGCYPARVGFDAFGEDRTKWVLFPGNAEGLHPSELLLPEFLKWQGYSTAIVGKWHLGEDARTQVVDVREVQRVRPVPGDVDV